MERNRENRGITLIALVITIVVLIILATISINAVFSEDGIINKAEQAKEHQANAEASDSERIDILEDSIESKEPPKPAGEEVQKPEKWEDTVKAIADGKGNVIPVPIGFHYLEGNKADGFVIQHDTDSNEFVFVPVENSGTYGYGYDRHAFVGDSTNQVKDEATGQIKQKSEDTYYYTEAMPTDEQTSVGTYGGYYIGRYEAGINTERTEADKATLTKPVLVQKNKFVYNYVTRDQAIELAEGLYTKTTNNVTSKLCSSYAWDTALKFMATKNSSYPTNSEGGWYSQSAFTTTGQTIAQNNIYDMGGNVWELTTETCSYSGYECAVRGGFYGITAINGPASARNGGSTTGGSVVGLRVTLYM